MPSALTYWRKTNRLSAQCVKHNYPDTHARADHIGDFVTSTAAGNAAGTSDKDRTDFALIIVTDIPVGVAQKLKKWLRKMTWIDDDRSKGFDRPKILNLDIPLIKAEYPALSGAIDKLFDPERTLAVNLIPEFTWAKFRRAVWDKINLRVVPEAQYLTDPGY